MSSTTADLGELSSAIQELLKLSPEDAELLPKTEKLVELLRTEIQGSEHLRRYRAVRERMGRDEESFVAPPNYTYTLHTA
jgi:hypothetical protein